MRLAEPIIFNCTGLGARALFNDQKLGPVRGQLEVLLPQPEIDYCYLSRGYMFPRRDGIILGGTFDHDDWSLAPRADQAQSIFAFPGVRDWLSFTAEAALTNTTSLTVGLAAGAGCGASLTLQAEGIA